MEIRRATLSDIDPVCGLYDEFLAYNARLQPKYYKAGKEAGDYPKSVIASEDANIFIAAENGAACGLIHVRRAQTPRPATKKGYSRRACRDAGERKGLYVEGPFF